MKSASDALGIAPSGLSDSIKVLENRFGTALLIRHKSGVTPTSEGERVYQSASGIVDLLNEALGVDDSNDLAGTCRLSVPTEVASTCIGRSISFLGEHHPNLDLKLFAEDAFVDHSRFARDYFLRIAPKLNKSEGLRTIWTGTAKAILVASSGRVTAEQAHDADALSDMPAVVGTANKPPYGYALKNPKGRISFASAIGVSHPSIQLTLAVQGHGVTGCLDICAAEHLRTGALRQILPDRFSIPLDIHLMTPHRRKTHRDAPMVAAMDHMMQTP